MYTGTTERPCCLCGDPETVTRLDLPPRTVRLMRNGDPIAWRDIVGTVTIYFCASDWELVSDLVLDVGMSPLPRCNVAHASFSIREDFEAFVNATRPEQDQAERETRALDRSRRIVERVGEDDTIEHRDVVEAKIVLWALDELDATPARDRAGPDARRP